MALVAILQLTPPLPKTAPKIGKLDQIVIQFYEGCYSSSFISLTVKHKYLAGETFLSGYEITHVNSQIGGANGEGVIGFSEGL